MISTFTTEFYENLLTYFIKYDLSEFNVRKIPMTEAKQDLIEASQSPLDVWICQHYDELCKGIEEFELCQKWRTAPITYDKFKELVLKYKKEKEPNIITDDEDTKDFQYYLGLVISFVLRYNVYYISALIGIFILILILKQKDNFKIEWLLKQKNYSKINMYKVRRYGEVWKSLCGGLQL